MLLPIQISLFVMAANREAIFLVTYESLASLARSEKLEVNQRTALDIRSLSSHQSARKNTIQCFSVFPLQRTQEENHRGMTLTSTNYEHCAKAVA